MKSKVIVVIVVLLVVISACKKNGLFGGSKISTSTDFKRQYILTYTYNADGSVASITKNTGGDTTFQYNTGEVLQDGLSNNNVVTAIAYHLNSSSYADSAQGEFVIHNYMATFAYDGNGQLTQQKTFNGATLINTDNYTNINKNVNEIQHINSGGVSTYDYFSYFNSNTNTIGVQNHGKYFLGVSTNNLMATDVKLANNLDTTDIISFKYRYDGNGNVDTLVSYNRAGQEIDSMAFTYY